MTTSRIIFGGWGGGAALSVFFSFFFYMAIWKGVCVWRGGVGGGGVKVLTWVVSRKCFHCVEMFIDVNWPLQTSWTRLCLTLDYSTVVAIYVCILCCNSPSISVCLCLSVWIYIMVLLTDWALYIRLQIFEMWATWAFAPFVGGLIDTQLSRYRGYKSSVTFPLRLRVNDDASIHWGTKSEWWQVHWLGDKGWITESPVIGGLGVNDD